MNLVDSNDYVNSGVEEIQPLLGENYNSVESDCLLELLSQGMVVFQVSVDIENTVSFHQLSQEDGAFVCEDIYEQRREFGGSTSLIGLHPYQNKFMWFYKKKP